MTDKFKKFAHYAFRGSTKYTNIMSALKSNGVFSVRLSMEDAIDETREALIKEPSQKLKVDFDRMVACYSEFMGNLEAELDNKGNTNKSL